MKVTKATKQQIQKFVIDCKAPSDDQIFDCAAFEKFLHDRIKINGRTNNLGELMTIQRTHLNHHKNTK